MRRATVLVIPIALAWVVLGAATSQAGLYKCRQPDGSILYQQTICPADAEGGALTVDTSPLGGAEAPTARDTSVEGQLKAMEKARAAERKAKASRDPSEAQAPDTRDRARCAKHRAESARWRQEIRNGYRDQDEKVYEQQKYQEHQALVERYCGAD